VAADCEETGVGGRTKVVATRRSVLGRPCGGAPERWRFARSEDDTPMGTREQIGTILEQAIAFEIEAQHLFQKMS
jgi:hypothetical protein